jgi:CDP-glycerol glycerophosphotransferase (TagB/SpsB family)
MDRLMTRLAEAPPRSARDGLCVLVAPTWGANGLFARFGARLPQLLLDAGFDVIIRPHPQSYTSEKEMLASLTEELAGYPKLRWDDAGDGFESMAEADLLVSDQSGIVFDYAFVFERPAITVRFPFQRAGLEASDLPGELWESTVLDKVGAGLDEADLDTLPELVRRMAASADLRESIRSVKQQNLFNPGQAGATAARQILEIQRELAGTAVRAS